MKCNIITCINNDDCAILDITNRQPRDWRSCSYFKSQDKADRIEEKKTKEADKPKRKYTKKIKPNKEKK